MKNVIMEKGNHNLKVLYKHKSHGNQQLLKVYQKLIQRCYIYLPQIVKLADSEQM